MAGKTAYKPNPQPREPKFKEFKVKTNRNFSAHLCDQDFDFKQDKEQVIKVKAEFAGEVVKKLKDTGRFLEFNEV